MRRASLVALLLTCACPADGTGAATGNTSTTTASAPSATTNATSSASSDAVTDSSAPDASASVSSAAEPDGSAVPKPRPAYTGPSGTLKGVVKVTGDPPPLTKFTYPTGCEAASGVYGKLFRVGQDGQLADAVVMVTDYTKAHIPPKSDVIRVEAKNCAYDTRSIVMTDGQYLEVFNLDPMMKYIPHLDGARLPVARVAIPRGDGIKLYSRGQQRYWLRDQMGKDFMVAHVFHLPYSTADVTSLDGRYEIAGVPVGKAKITVMLPQTKNLKSVSKSIEVKEGDNTIDLEFVFDAKTDTPDDGHGGTKPGR